MEIGARVGAFLSSDSKAKVLKFLGYGTYEGKEAPPKKEGDFISQLGIPTPKLKLDNGETVWGYQCYWSAQDEMEERIQGLIDNGFTITEVKLSDRV